MKKIFFSSVLLVFVFTGFCQTQKGSWLLGGNIEYSSISSKENGNGSGSTSVFQFNPKAGLFVVNNFAVILNTTYTSLSGDGFSDHNLSIGPAVRYYFPGSEKLKFFVGAGMGFGSSSDTHNTSYQFEAGPAIFITPSVALEVTLNYESATATASQSDYKLTQSKFGGGIGFMIYLGKHKS
jgi:outer membrane protein